MTDNIYVYEVNLPRNVNEAVRPCSDGYTVYVKSSLDKSEKIKAYRHALFHIKNNDFDAIDTQEIEGFAHVGGKD